jgi:L-lactate dehydrogenase complex protein LldE
MPDSLHSAKTVYFFGTCLADMIYPDTGMAAIRLLEREGLRVVFPRRQSCCGQPAYNSGFPAEAREVARHQLRLFTKNWPIVVPSGSCAGMMKHHYPQLFADDPDYALACRFAERVFELGEYLNSVLKVDLTDQGPPMKVAWHSSCHALREMQVIEDAKALLGQLNNVELLPLENEQECCGFGGTFSVKQPGISSAMVLDKINHIRQTGAARVLTGDCGCLMNIAGALEKAHIPVQGQHLADFLWERTHG